MQRARLRSGIELHYAEQGTGSPLVLVHGGTGDLLSWRPQMAAFARRHRVIAYSRRYSYPNRNPKVPRGYCAYHDAEDLSALLEHLGLERARIVGTSYGALAALALALERPAVVDRLALAEPPAHRLTPPAVYRRFIAEVWKPAGIAFRKGRARDALRILVDGMWGHPAFERLPGAVVRTMVRNASSMRALVLSRDPFPPLAPRKLKRLRVPVLLIAGEHAAPIHRLANDALARLLPQVAAHTIPGASHGSPRENPAAFNRVVLQFLEAKV